ncbi:hypothetical protein PDESU_02571 [Pontiella desulfatans]|uniref:alpha-L-rhamnosidase n=2 Tax=Pontiella desulfatans TaxID=2750659 RepID=A0A6C2U303_PONDE|nr:hypothetical protein PDESU_02571 [Pontiella desulfatans]
MKKPIWITAVLLLIAPARAEWGTAEWIGYTNDTRTGSSAERLVHPKRMKEPESRRVYVSPLLRKGFTVDKPVRSASVKVCGLGLHELYLNGERVGDQVLVPAPTSYDRRSFYTVYDVTEHLLQGNNALGLWLGNGFYGQDFAFAAPRLLYGAPRAKLLLTVEYTDGSRMEVLSDLTWKAAQSPIVFDNLYAGETYDARNEIPCWSEPGFDDAAWNPVEQMGPPTDTVLKQELEPIRKMRAVQPVSAWAADNGDWILDLGENMAGWIELNLDEPRGTEIELRFAELLMPGRKAIDTASTGVHATGVEQRDIYICKGGGETWEPRFTYHGFRYVQIKGLSKKPDLDDFTGWFVHTDLKRTGSFECSEPRINTYYEVSLRTIEGNLHGLLSDCPHRERCAWLGDMHVTAETINMNYAANNLWRKHVKDFKTVLGVEKTVAQHYPEGQQPEKDPRSPPNIACGKRLCGQARPDWGMAVVLIPWFNWLYYGDQETVEDAWPMMTDYMEFLAETTVHNHLIKEGYAYGDWCPPGGKDMIDTPPQLSASILYYRSNILMAHMAKLLGKQGEVKPYLERAERIKAAINRKYFNPEDNHYGSQTGTAMALTAGLAPDGKEMAVAAGLNHLIIEKGGYTTGIMGHRHLYTALNDHGFEETTAMLWQKTDFPGLAYMTETHELTTWPEVNSLWIEGERYSGQSFNHPMQSGFAVTFHESICGIRPNPDFPGYERFVLKPCFQPGLEWAKAEYESPKGKISSHWKRRGDNVVWRVAVPKNSSARVELPAGVLVNGKTVGADGLNLAAGEWNLDVSR